MLHLLRVIILRARRDARRASRPGAAARWTHEASGWQPILYRNGPGGRPAASAKMWTSIANSLLQMFNPSRDQVREFFIETWRKHRASEVLTPLEIMALDWIIEHPEYHGDLESPEAMTAEYAVEKGRTNPFLHLSMHLAIAEQLSIDHPPGIRRAYQKLVSRSDAHHAAHEIMECLGQVVWEAQRLGKPLDSDSYVELIRQRAER